MDKTTNALRQDLEIADNAGDAGKEASEPPKKRRFKVTRAVFAVLFPVRQPAKSIKKSVSVLTSREQAGPSIDTLDDSERAWKVKQTRRAGWALLITGLAVSAFATLSAAYSPIWGFLAPPIFLACAWGAFVRLWQAEVIATAEQIPLKTFAKRFFTHGRSSRQ